MTRNRLLPPRLLGRFGVALALGLPSLPANAGDAPLPPAGVRAVGGAVAPTAAPAVPSHPATASVPVAEALRSGETLRVDGVRDRRFRAAGGAVVRALPGAVFTVLADKADVLTLRLDEGTLADVDGGAGRVEIWTRAFDVKSDRARVSARDLPGGVYVEHVAGSVGTVTLVASNRSDVQLVAGTFRMATFDDAPAAPPTAARVTPITPAVTTTSYPSVIAAPRLASVPSPAAVLSRPLPVRALASFDGSAGTPVVPAPGPCVGGCDPCAPAPVCAPCAPVCAPVCTTGCGEMLTTSGVPIPDRAPDTGRIPLGSALGARGPCNSCAGTECNRIPYVHYVEGLVCDVSTYKVGCCLITVRPASRVRAHRLPDGSLELWAPNIGKDLALIEINDNQFGYIGEDGFLVIGADCQIEYFRGLVHLYSHRSHHDHDHPNPRKPQQVTEDRVIPVPVGSPR